MAKPDWEQGIRTLVKVDKINYKEGKMDLVVPSWDPKRKVTMSLLRVERPELLDQIREGRWFLAMANLAAKTPRQLLVHNFESAPPPVSERELAGFSSI